MKYLLIILPFLLNGCAQTSVVMLDESKALEPTKNVQILTETPRRAYKKIALLEATGPVNTPMPKLLKSMRNQAMTIGADAVIPTENASKQMQQSLMYNPWLGGYQTIGGGTLPVIRGVAIKFVDEQGFAVGDGVE